MKNRDYIKSLSLKVRLCLLSMVLTFTLANASNKPNWSITPSQFQFSMNVTAVLNIDCTELNNDSNVVGAFVAGVCRGVVKTKTTVGGHKLAYLLVYSNSGSGETVSFKYYNATADSVGLSKVTLAFTDNATFGSNNSPFVIKNNDAPSSIALTVTSIPESDTVNQVISSISCMDVDLADTHTYTLVSGAGSADNGKMAITGNSLILKAALNYYLQDSLLIRIRATDNRGCYYEQVFVIHITAVNHAPNGLHLSDSTVFDHQAASTFVALLSGKDPDPNETFTYAFTTGVGDTNNLSFRISNDTLFTVTSLDSLVKPSYTVRIRVFDHAMAHFERAIQIKVKDFPDSPISISLSSTRVYEDLPAGTFIAIISTGDDIGPPYSYTFSNTGTNDNSSFIISNDTLKSGALFDFEIKNLYAILITSTNSKGHALTKPFSISIRDTLDTPTDMAIDNALISENMPVHIRVGVLSTRDDNGPNAAHAYTFVTGPGSADNASFSISNDTLFSNSRFDFESRTTYQVRIRSTLANNLFFDKAFAVNVTEGADTITNILISKNTIYQNRPANTIIGKLTTISQDTADLYTYAFDNSVANDNASFFLSPNGLISSTQSFDFEVKSTYLISVKSSNVGGTSFVKQLNILVKDTLETPTDLLLSDSLVADNKPGHTYIGKLATVDENGLALHAYTLVSGIGSSSDSSFTIGHDSLFIKSVADFESRATYSIRVRSTLVNGMNFEKAFHVYVTTKGEGPHAHADSLSVKENAKPYYITTVTASDSDANATLHYKLLTTGVPFTMDSSGKLSLSGALNYQTNKRYVLSFSVSDELSPANHDSALVIVTVLPVAEAILPINNYVSPNGDGKNDYLVIQNADVYREYELTIYNSNGMVVLKTNGYDNSWNGSGLDAGVYYYTFFGSTKYKGNITLVK